MASSSSPSCDGFYRINGPYGALTHSSKEKCPAPEIPIGKTLRPIVTGSSILGVTFADGVIIAADTLGSYGSLARYRDISRLLKISDNTVAGGSGDFADLQYIERLFEDVTIHSDSLCDGYSYTPQSYYSYLTRVMYNRRTKINPLWNSVVIGGYHDNKPFLGVVNSLGVAFEGPTLATGFGSYIAQPLLAEAYSKNSAMTKEEAQELLIKCLTILYYRDARSWNKYELATIGSDGVTVSGPLKLVGNWEVANYVRGYD